MIWINEEKKIYRLSMPCSEQHAGNITERKGIKLSERLKQNSKILNIFLQNMESRAMCQAKDWKNNTL